MISHVISSMKYGTNCVPNRFCLRSMTLSYPHSFVHKSSKNWSLRYTTCNNFSWINKLINIDLSIGQIRQTKETCYITSQLTPMTKRIMCFSSYVLMILYLSVSVGFPSVMSTRTLVASGEAPASGFPKISSLKQIYPTVWNAQDKQNFTYKYE